MVSQGTDYKSVFTYYLKLMDQKGYKFSGGYIINVSPDLSF